MTKMFVLPQVLIHDLLALSSDDCNNQLVVEQL